MLRDIPVTRPDRIEVDQQGLFGVQARELMLPGLYVLVRDGHVAVSQGGQAVDLGAGESAYADPAGARPVRLESPPALLRQDPYPRPDRLTPEVIRIIEVFTGPRTGTGTADNECEVR